MMQARLRILAAAVAGTAAALMAGCAIPVSVPYRRVASENVVPSGQTVVVALTSTTFERPARRRFFARTREVMQDLPNHDGLLGYAVRFEIFGTRAWTQSVWRDEAAMKRFATARVHRGAQRDGEEILQSVRSLTVVVPVERVPLKWREARKLIDGASE